MLKKIKFNHSVSENQNNLFTPQHQRSRCVIKYNNKQYSFDYQYNPTYDEPSLKWCLECLFNDMYAFEDSKDVVDFALNFGYTDNDLTSAKKDYKACEKTSKALHRIFTDDELEELYKDIYEN